MKERPILMSAPNLTDWRPLAQTYHAHHWHCTTCRSAGPGLATRCPTGADLWNQYQQAFTTTPTPFRIPERTEA